MASEPDVLIFKSTVCPVRQTVHISFVLPKTLKVIRSQPHLWTAAPSKPALGVLLAGSGADWLLQT